ncbi:MAG: two-component regulator propeller domain-containing protein [Lishizhenia sp.]
MRSSVVVLILLLSYCGIAQIGTGQWRLHAPSNSAVDLALLNASVHCAMPDILITYDVNSGERTIRNSVGTLSDNDITALGTFSDDNLLFIGYSTGNIDVLANESIINLPYIVTSQITGSKRIWSIKSYKDLVYIATGFGIVVIDPIKMEVRDTYFPTSGNAPIIELSFQNDTIFALGENTLYKGNVNNPFLADAALWEIDDRLPAYSNFGKYNGLISAENNLYVSFNHTSYAEDSVFNLTTNSVLLSGVEVGGINADESFIYANTVGGSYIFELNESLKEVIYDYVGGVFPNSVATAFFNGNYYIADRANGFVKAPNAFSTSFLNVEGPASSKSYKLDWQGDRLVVASGGLNGGNPSFNNSGIYTFYEEKWTNINRDNQSLLNAVEVWDYLAVAVDPENSDNFAVGTYSKIPLFLIENGTTVTDTFNNANSFLEATSLGNSWTYISDLNYDSKGNLWVANCYANRPLKVLGENGFWYDFELPNAVKNRVTGDVLVDYNDIKWMAVEDAGLIAFSEGANFDDTSDDKFKIFNTGESTGALPINDVTTIAVDFDNEIWIGTSKGLRILYNSEAALEADFGEYNFQKLVIEFGENNEEVLKNVDIVDIEVDGANRKWIATAGAGVFLFSEDGLEIIAEFNEENSPLISNEITDLEIDQNTGEIFIATNKGLCSYRGDASYGDFDYEDVVVFPNPVLPNHSGLVTIQGIAFDSDVKITDVSGNLVYSTTSNGGTATWNGKTLSGERASTGVYLIWTATNEGKGRKVGKVVFVN